ncbi:hypothetical protein HDZ31DRAFT_42586 [Schizophyllum fasciatum]
MERRLTPVFVDRLSLNIEQALKNGSIDLDDNFMINFILRIFRDSEANLALGPFRADAVEKDLTQAEQRAYKLTKILPKYVPMPWVVKFAWDSIHRRDLKMINNPGLFYPTDPASVPRAPRYNWLMPGKKTDGSCARKYGHSWPLKVFESDVQLGKVNMNEVAALSEVVPERGRTYSFDELFPPGAFPGEVMGSCCGYHRDETIKTLDAFFVRPDRPRAPCQPKESCSLKPLPPKLKDSNLNAFFTVIPGWKRTPRIRSPDILPRTYHTQKLTVYFPIAARQA